MGSWHPKIHYTGHWNITRLINKITGWLKFMSCLWLTIGQLCFAFCCTISIWSEWFKVLNARRLKDSEIRRKKNITNVMARKAPSEEAIPMRDFAFFLIHLTPGIRMLDIPIILVFSLMFHQIFATFFMSFVFFWTLRKILIVFFIVILLKVT